ncbi:MAG TPA: class I SAM-dependent methyltransferase [Candidatus Omnitrophica bacterium]|nr:class I SAM-dependent methyltransferase [Candidatus Omnitrophota bacterium]
MVKGPKFDKKYFSSFWRKGDRRRFHPIYDFRVWYIRRFLKPKNLLDVGCGRGWIIKDLRRRKIAAWGMDISEAALSAVPQDIRKYCFIGNIKKIPVKDKAYDVVSCIDVLEHIPKEDLSVAIRERARVAEMPWVSNGESGEVLFYPFCIMVFL